MNTKLPTMTSIAMGLDAIFSANQHASLPIEKKSDVAATKKMSVHQIKVSPFQARKVFSDTAIAELAESIRQHGILQPLLVRQKNNEYELLAGERRLRAALQLNLSEVPVIECDIDDATAMAYGLIENIQRQDLNAIEEACAYEKLLHEFQLSHDLLAEKVGKSRSHITNLLRLNRLPDNIKQYLLSGEISMGHARAILSLTEVMQQKIVTRIIQEGLSVRQTEQWVKKLLEPADNKSQPVFTLSNELKNDMEAWKNQLKEKFHADIRIQFDGQGRGRLLWMVESESALRELMNALHV